MLVVCRAIHNQNTDLRKIQQQVVDMDRIAAAQVPTLSASHLQRAISLLSHGYRCPHLEDWAASPQQRSLTKSGQPLHCFDPTVPEWVPISLARSQNFGSAFLSARSEPVILQALQHGWTPLSSVNTSQAASTYDSVPELGSPASGNNTAVKAASPLAVVDASVQYDSSLLRAVKARIWRFRKAPLLAALTEVR